MSINNSHLLKLSTPVFWLLVLAFGALLVLHLITGFGETYLYQSAATVLFVGFVLKKTTFVIKYSSNSDYLEFSTGNLFSLNEMSIKSRIVRLIKKDVSEIDVVGFLFWKKLRVRFIEDGRRYTLNIPLLFVSRRSVNRMIENMTGESTDAIPLASTAERVIPTKRMQPIPTLVVR